ncbi:thiol:disulfide interchange protein DsbA/DsbL [Salinisphaera sp. T31B1]|uniref:thiol:disulfide interchange protein DsbA/DsbL n=1 Tax=Salinisphaera sp. T31B1 TaxID=727963 RepID=UPI00333E5D48
MGQRITVLVAFGLMLFAGWASAQSLVTRYVAGDHYQVVDQPVAEPDDGKIHVVEFFLYSCPHCFHLEPELNEWRAGLGDDVVFSRVPALFGAGGQMYARLYYAAQQLGVLEDVHEDIFDAIHEQGRRLLSETDMRTFMEAHGVDGDRFERAFKSDAVSAKVRQAGEIMRAMHVTATPSLGVAGRYYISGRTAGSNQRMFDVADYLIAQQRSQAR